MSEKRQSKTEVKCPFCGYFHELDDKYGCPNCEGEPTRCDTCGHLYGSDDEYGCQYCRPSWVQDRVDTDDDEVITLNY